MSPLSVLSRFATEQMYRRQPVVTDSGRATAAGSECVYTKAIRWAGQMEANCGW